MSNDAAAAAAIYTIDKYIKGVDDQISTEIVELFWFMDRKKRFVYNSGGTGISWNVRLERGTPQGFARETRLNVVRKNRTQQARLTNRGYGIGELVHQTDLWENRQPEALADFLEDLLEGMTGDLYNTIGTGVYDNGATSAVTDALGFQGFEAAMITTGTYANINVATYTSFAGNASSAAPYSQFSQDPIPALDAAIRDCIAGAELGRRSAKPDVGFMSRANYDICSQTFQRSMRLGKDKTSMDLGWDDNFVYKGVTFFPSDYVDSDKMALMASKYVDFRFPTPKFINTWRYSEGVPKAEYIIMIVYGLMRVKAPRTCGLFTLA